MSEIRKFVRIVSILKTLLVVLFLFVSCTCSGSGLDEDDDDDANDDTDNDDNDDVDDDNDTDDDIAGGWYVYTIDEKYAGDGFTSIAVDAKNKVHIAYYAYTDNGIPLLRYATNESEEWGIYQIDSASVGVYLGNHAISVDSNYKICIVYNGDRGKLKYATDKTGSWQTFVLDSLTSGTTGEYASIALDSNDKLHISYFECGKIDEFGCSISDIKYITNKSGVWQKVVIEDMHLEEQGYETSIAVDKDGHVHMSYFVGGRGLKYATDSSGLWERFLVDEGPARMSSIAVDSLGNVHISYIGWCYGARIKYATNALGSWETFVIDFGDCDFPSIAVDSQDKVHISYSVEQGEDSSLLRYATNKSGAWKKTTIDLSGDAGWYSSIAVDSDDYVHISYYDRKNKHLKYATNRPPE